MEQVSILSAYMWSCVVMVVFFLLAVLVANMILFKPGNTGVTQRRVWFWVFGALSFVIGFCINYFIIRPDITIPNLRSSYTTHSCIAAAISLLVYIILGFILSKIFNKSKIGTWF